MSENDTLVNGRSSVTKVSSGATIILGCLQNPGGKCHRPHSVPEYFQSSDLANGTTSIKINGALA